MSLREELEQEALASASPTFNASLSAPQKRKRAAGAFAPAAAPAGAGMQGSRPSVEEAPAPAPAPLLPQAPAPAPAAGVGRARLERASAPSRGTQSRLVPRTQPENSSFQATVSYPPSGSRAAPGGQQYFLADGGDVYPIAVASKDSSWTWRDTRTENIVWGSLALVGLLALAAGIWWSFSRRRGRKYTSMDTELTLQQQSAGARPR